MTSETYCGPLESLRGCTALTQPSREAWSPMLRAQFDDCDLYLDGAHLAYGWHEFPARHFRSRYDV